MKYPLTILAIALLALWLAGVVPWWALLLPFVVWPAIILAAVVVIVAGAACVTISEMRSNARKERS